MKPNEKLMERLPPIPEHLAIDLRQIANNLDTKAGYETLDAQQIRDAANLIESLTPRPIEEAPRDVNFLGYIPEKDWKICVYEDNKFAAKPRPYFRYSLRSNCDRENQPTQFIPLSAIQQLTEI